MQGHGVFTNTTAADIIVVAVCGIGLAITTGPCKAAAGSYRGICVNAIGNRQMQGHRVFTNATAADIIVVAVCGIGLAITTGPCKAAAGSYHGICVNAIGNRQMQSHRVFTSTTAADIIVVAVCGIGLAITTGPCKAAADSHRGICVNSIVNRQMQGHRVFTNTTAADIIVVAVCGIGLAITTGPCKAAAGSYRGICVNAIGNRQMQGHRVFTNTTAADIIVVAVCGIGLAITTGPCKAAADSY